MDGLRSCSCFECLRTGTPLSWVDFLCFFLIEFPSVGDRISVS